MRNAARRGLWATCVCASLLAATSLLKGATLPTPWTNRDIGAVGLAGSTSFASGVFKVSGAGSDIWGTADSFQAVMQPITGDVQIAARVTSIQNTDTFAKAGVMLRSTLSAGSPQVILDVRPNGTIEFMTRSVTGGQTSYIAGATQTAPVWLKLARTGTTVTGFVSTNGTTWSPVGSTPWSVPAAANAGLAVTSHTVTQLNTATFDNVSIDGGGTLTAPWQNVDIGAVGIAGSGSSMGGVFSINGAGSDIWGTADSFHAVEQTLAGDAQIVVRVTGLQNTNTFAKAGVMLRDSTAANAAHVIIDLRPTGDIEFMTRPSTGAATSYLAGAFMTAPAWLKLSRSGTLVTGFVSGDGATWTSVGSTTVTFGKSPIAAMVVTSHTTSQLNAASFDNVSAGPLATALPNAPSSPLPSNGATGVSTPSTTLSWTDSGATSYDINFGTTNPPMLASAGLTSASYAAASLTPGVTYFWQVVAKNSGGSIVGPVWSFTTASPLAPPSQPATPSPLSGATGVSSSLGLSWSSVGATSYDIAFGTSNPPPSAATGLTVAAYAASNLQAGTTYYWQVVAKNGGGSSAGPVWSFTTSILPPAAPSSPSPSSGTTGISASAVTLSWTAAGATTYDLNFGTTNPPAAVTTGLTTPAYVISNLQQGTTYYWQIVARNAGGSSVGQVWAFTTVAAPPTTPTSPSPSTGATGVQPPSTVLSWSSTGATTYDVAFGTTNPPPVASTGISTASYAVSNLQQGTTYYWQVTARNSGGATSGALWSFATTTPVTTSGVPSRYNAITDRVARTKPAVPQLGPAGYTFTDPTFGSTLVRITDGQTRPGVVNRSFRVPSNAHAAEWNANSTAFFVISNDGTIIPFKFDPIAMTASRYPSAANENGGFTLSFYTEPQFSLVNPNVIYGGGGSNNRTILSYDFSAGTYSTVVNLDNLVSGLDNTYIGTVTTGNVSNETLLTFFGGGVQDAHYYALLQPLAGGPSKLLNTVASTINGVATSTVLNFHIHAMQIDKTGQYVFIYPSGADLAAPRNASQVYLWDTSTDTITPVTAHPAGHDAAGFGVWINQDCCTSSSWDAAQWQFRWLANPTQTSDLITPILTPQEIYMADHTTWSNAQPDRLVPVISSTYRYGINNTTPWRAWDDEIIAIDTTNGVGGTVWRFAHHRSNVASDTDPSTEYFWYEPIANISPDGKWVLFTSNWEKTLGTDSSEGTARQDVFLVQLIPAQ